VEAKRVEAIANPVRGFKPPLRRIRPPFESIDPVEFAEEAEVEPSKIEPTPLASESD
jgi:hypothetical protein